MDNGEEGIVWVLEHVMSTSTETLGYGDMCELIAGALETVPMPEGHSQRESGKASEEG